ncbi:MAG TPA: hypothetical protein VGO89_16735 [Streptomyces sp.]|nr:hypothetical protein [Streptomyces sp.]
MNDRNLEVDISGNSKSARLAPRITAFVMVAGLALVFAVSNRSFARVWAFVDFASGVVALLLLTFTVMWGVVAADRFILDPSHRLIAQAIHRGTSVGGIIFLGLHIWSKLALGSTSWKAAAVPFLDGAQPVLIGLGTIAAYLFLAVAVTGAVRGAFARKGQSRLWRALHMTAYIAWGCSLVHGLRAGRAVAYYVDGGYAICLTSVTVVLMMRLAPPRGAKRSPSKKEQR